MRGCKSNQTHTAAPQAAHKKTSAARYQVLSSAIRLGNGSVPRARMMGHGSVKW
eukprot:COSAG03_NODE_16781_length_392_cov_1.170648_1_plen_53_part_10